MKQQAMQSACIMMHSCMKQVEKTVMQVCSLADDNRSMVVIATLVILGAQQHA